MSRNVALYPWFKFFQNLIFWQAVWFLYFQNTLSAAEAIALYAVYDIATTCLEVPSGYMSDRLGRRRTLIMASLAAILGSALLAIGGAFLGLCGGAGLHRSLCRFRLGDGQRVAVRVTGSRWTGAGH